MGLFSNKYVTTVGTSVVRLIPDTGLPASIKTGMTKASISNDDQVIEYIMEELVNSIGLRAERMYEYAKRSYAYGLPSGKLFSSTDGMEDVKRAIASEINTPFSIDYYHLTQPNILHMGWVSLVNTYGYDEETNQINQLSTLKGFPVYLDNMVVVVKEATIQERANGSLDQWGTSPSSGYTPDRPFIDNVSLGNLSTHDSFEVDSLASEDYLRVTYTWVDDKKIKFTGTLFITPSNYDDDGDYYHVKYTYGPTFNKKGYWFYKIGAGTHPSVDDVFNTTSDTAGSYFPFAYFRYNKVMDGEDKTTPEYKTSKKLLKYLSVDYDDMIKSISENPDIKDIEQAMLVMAVPANTTNPIEQRYLFDYFEQLLYVEIQNNPNLTSQSRQSYFANRIAKAVSGAQEAHTTVIQDKRFKLSLSYQYIDKRVRMGKIGKIGEFNSEFTNVPVTQNVEDVITNTTVEWTTSESRHVYRKQISENIYEELSVHGLSMTYHIFGAYTAVGDGSDAQLLIPIDRSVARDYPISEREVLYSRSLQLVFNSRVVTTVKWYQQKWFSILIIIITVVITILTYGATWQAMAAAIVAGTVTTAMVISMIIGFLQYMLTSYLIRLFIKAVGPKAAFLVALVAALAGAVDAIDTGSLTGAPWAADLMQLSSSLASGVSDAIGDAMLSLKHEADLFKIHVDDQTKLLDKANDLLDMDNALKPLIPLIVWGETPAEYYGRTVHAGNIGVMGIDAVSSYVDTALSLPKLNESLGESENDN